MRDEERSPEPDDEPYDLDAEEPYDLDGEALLELAVPAPPEPEEPAAIDLTPDIPAADLPPLITKLGSPLNWRSLSDEKERERAIAEVLRDQARREVLRDVAYRASGGASLRLRVVAAALVVAALLVWFLPVPGFRASIPFPLAPEEETAGLKLATWVQAQQVEAFRQTRGRLPDVLREVGEAVPGVTYERIDAQTYRLSGTTERTAFTWTSTDTLDTRTRETVARLRGEQP